MSTEDLPPWAVSLLRCPRTGDTLRMDGGCLLSTQGMEVGRIEAGVLRIPIEQADEGIAFYRKVGGAHFHERASVAFAMSALDTPLYHSYLNNVRPADLSDVIVDVGGGDGRNARPWLERGYRRVVIVDAAAEALIRFRTRIADENSEWLNCALLIEADARSVPLAGSCAQTVLALEALCYLNEDYEVGLKECARLLARGGRMLISERDYEAGLVMRLLYQGLDGLLQSARTRSLWDGPPSAQVRTKCFTQAELVELLHACGLNVLSVQGMPLLALLLGWMHGQGRLDEGHADRLPEVSRLLAELGREGVLRRCHVVACERT